MFLAVSIERHGEHRDRSMPSKSHSDLHPNRKPRDMEKQAEKDGFGTCLHSLKGGRPVGFHEASTPVTHIPAALLFACG